MQSRSDQSKEAPARDVRLFSTENSVMAVDSPIKLRILEFIAPGPQPFDRIVAETKKAKSTISVHIRDLEASGLITVQPDPRDTRRRLVGLSSDAIGKLTNADRHARLPAHVHERLAADRPFSDDDIVSFFRFCVQVFRTQAMVMGINLDPVLERTGHEVGTILAPRVAGRTVDEVVRKMDAFWQAHGLGEIFLAGTSPITLEVRGCFECEDLPVTGHGACSFDIGVLTAIFSHHLACPVSVIEEKCYSSGDERCIFVISRHPDKE
jgi:predicted hydrocarbon binding protein